MTAEKYQEVMDAMALARETVKGTCDTIREGLDRGDDPVVFLNNMADSFGKTVVFREGGSGAGLYVMAAFLLLEMQGEMESWRETAAVLADPETMADLAEAAAEDPGPCCAAHVHPGCVDSAVCRQEGRAGHAS